MITREKILELMQKKAYTLDDLICITQILRSQDGCPWDREQNHHSIRTCLIEETYEVAEAIDTENSELLKEELGDLLFQIVFHAQLETEQGNFGMDEVIHGISTKMIHRHPHVFGEIQAENSADVLKNWEVIKAEEKQRNTLAEKLRAVPPMMPALMRAAKVGKKAGQASGLTSQQLLDKLSDMIAQMKNTATEKEDAVHQIGALLMTVTALSQALDVDAEYALKQETDALIERIAATSENNG